MKKIIFLTSLLILFFPQPYASSKEKWEEDKSQHFIIYYKDVPFDFVQTVENSAEQYYEEITDNLGFTRYRGWTFDRRAKIFIYDDQEDYVANSNQANWSHGAAFASAKIIQTFPSAHGFFDSILPHELGHIIFREFIGPYASIPLWFEEGIAMYQEKAKRWGADRFVKQMIKDGTFIALEDLTKMYQIHLNTREKVDRFYAESASIVYYLITEHGEHRFVRFCHNLKDGQPFEQALTSAYLRFKSIADLNKSWIGYLKDH